MMIIMQPGAPKEQIDAVIAEEAPRYFAEE